eukprot:comp6538_c0_seq1/m.2306 comp6538_c0_seq1/g.2306  ORF comp6538_c0_seq1/g.2306 comp6538_c0_seq1/m.2306 type:complete len:283 (-) comp6538_c0_seq1:276-1124(-)
MAPNTNHTPHPTFTSADGHTLHADDIQTRNCIKLVGGGPGDPDLLTIAAYKALQQATLVVADRLTSKEIIALVPHGAELKIANKSPGCANESQDELNQWCLEGLQQGHRVVRLKNGDPFLFGRGGEEILFFRQHGFDAQVIPGVSSCLSAPLSAGIPVTHRGIANRLVVCTGMARENGYPDVPQYSANQTVVFLMAVGRSDWLIETLITKAGYPKECPAAVIEKATFPEQRTIWGTLENIVERSRAAGVKAPATMVVGGCVEALDAEHFSAAPGKMSSIHLL